MFERKNFYLTFASEDQKEGMKAFIEKESLRSRESDEGFKILKRYRTAIPNPTVSVLYFCKV